MAEWTYGALLNTPRYKHVCGVLLFGDDENVNIIVAAGGMDAFGANLQTVEILLYSQDSLPEEDILAEGWQLGPSLPVPLSDAASVTTPDQKAFLVIGGNTDDGISCGSVFKLSCSLLDSFRECSWTKVEYELTPPSAKGLVVTLPASPMSDRRHPGARDCVKGE